MLYFVVFAVRIFYGSIVPSLESSENRNSKSEESLGIALVENDSSSVNDVVDCSLLLNRLDCLTAGDFCRYWDEWNVGTGKCVSVERTVRHCYEEENEFNCENDPLQEGNCEWLRGSGRCIIRGSVPVVCDSLNDYSCRDERILCHWNEQEDEGKCEDSIDFKCSDLSFLQCVDRSKKCEYINFLNNKSGGCTDRISVTTFTISNCHNLDMGSCLQNGDRCEYNSSTGFCEERGTDFYDCGVFSKEDCKAHDKRYWMFFFFFDFFF
jgi:hypothetical protein